MDVADPTLVSFNLNAGEVSLTAEPITLPSDIVYLQTSFTGFSMLAYQDGTSFSSDNHIDNKALNYYNCNVNYYDENSQELTYNQTNIPTSFAVAPEMPAKTGQTYYWSTEPNGLTAFDFTTRITQPLSLYVVYKDYSEEENAEILNFKNAITKASLYADYISNGQSSSVVIKQLKLCFGLVGDFTPVDRGLFDSDKVTYGVLISSTNDFSSVVDQNIDAQTYATSNDCKITNTKAKASYDVNNHLYMSAMFDFGDEENDFENVSTKYSTIYNAVVYMEYEGHTYFGTPTQFSV